MSNLPAQFRQGIQSDAERYLVELYGTERGKAAAARVALAFSAAARAAKKPEALYECSRASFVSCIAMSAITDLMPGGPHPTVYLVPKGGELHWWLTHRGIATLALRAGYQIIAMPVHIDDPVRVEFGEVVEHNPNPDSWPDSLDDLRGVYVSVRRLSDGAQLGRPWMPTAAIRKRRSKSQFGTVWNEWTIEQAQKTAIKWAMARGYIPIEAPELNAALEQDTEHQQAIDVTPQPTVREVLHPTEPRQIAEAAPVPDEDLFPDLVEPAEAEPVDETPTDDPM